MIRRFAESDLTAVMKIWLDANMQAHNFVPKEYWTKNYDAVKEMLPQAEVYVHEDEETHRADGFIGLTDHYVAGIFIKEHARSKGIGKQLLNYAKERKPALCLSVYQKNTRAIAFYQREGFAIQSEHMDHETHEMEFTMTWSK